MEKPEFVYGTKSYYPLDLDVDFYYNLSGEQVKWLGYAPRNIPNYWLLERLGEEYGFSGINFDYLGETEIYYFVSYDGTYERWTFTEYLDKYFVTETSLEQFPRSDGTAYDYHILANPNGGACMWLVDLEQ
jgi:hypothetical protein